MLRKHNYSRQAFLPSDGELLYCALFDNPLSARKLVPVFPIVEVFCAAKMRAFHLDLEYFLKE